MDSRPSDGNGAIEVIQARWIVVGTDFSEGARWALQQAVRLAAPAGARLALVHAYEDQIEAPRSADDVTGAAQEHLLATHDSAFERGVIQ